MSERERLAEEFFVVRMRHVLGSAFIETVARRDWGSGRAGNLLILQEYLDMADAALAHVAEKRECWEPGHTHDVLMGDGTTETRRQPKVHCPMCTDAAMETTRRKVAEERARLVVALQKHASHPQDCGATRGSSRDCTCGLSALLADPAAATTDATGGGA